ncbi:MAG: YbfB/YjiJ family MFS transporter [Rhodospirillaceae bacterium]|jgi:predicted MFS family arabinose efflux permease|nr:YbfB/YjiJ family MFS transporter [Rhodospirillaceae bacterium]
MTERTIQPWVRVAFGAQATLLVGMGLGRFSYPPMMPALIESGALTSAEAGMVGAANLAGYIFGGLAAPVLWRRVEPSVLLRLCLVVAVVCLAASAVPFGFLWLAFWRGLVGIVVALMMILAISYVTRLAPPGRMGLATSIAFTGVGVGIFLSAAGLPWLLAQGLAWAWSGTAAIGFLGLLLGFWGWHGAPPLLVPAEPAPHAAKAGRSGILLVLAQACFSLGLVPHSIYWVDYLVRGLDWSLAEGGFQWVLFGLGAVLGTTLWGRLADRIGFTPGLVLIFLSLASAVALPVLWPGKLTVIYSSLVLGAQPGLSAVIAGSAQQAVGAGTMLALWRWMVLAVGATQAVGGVALVWLFEATGNYTPVFLVGAGAFALAAGLSARIGR